MKRIGIDARFFGAKDKGFGRYAENLIRNLEKIDSQNQYFIFLRRDSWDEYQPKNSCLRRGFGGQANFKKVLADYKWYSWKEQILLPLKLKKYKLDLVHFTHFNVPILYKGEFIVTIHDLTLRHFPTYKRNLKNFLIYPLKNLAYRIVFRHAIKNSKKIIAISNYTKQEILKYYKVNPDKIEVIYEGITGGSNFQFSNSNFQSIFNSQFSKPYILYVGNAYPHKNLKRLILAFKKLVDDGLDYQLVLIGGEDYFYKELKLEIRNLKLEIKNRIIFAGPISDGDLDILYRNASLFVFPSLSEGFGLPPLEAMARGVPVVSSNATCLPEILGNAALYFNPLDIDDMARVIKEALSNDRARKAMVAKGFKQIRKYSWEKMVEKTLNFYN